MNIPENLQPGLDDPRVVEALDEYLAALEAGRKPDRQHFLSRYAEIAGPLGECLDGLEALHQSSSASARPAGSAAASPDWRPGTLLGDFRIVREIGRGGMGIVYEAEQESLGRRIALKVLPFALTLDPRQLQRFKNEARAAAQLHHQNIVPVYHVGSERGVHFYAMEYIDGQSLAEVIAGLRPHSDWGSGPAGEVTGSLPGQPADPSAGTAPLSRPAAAATTRIQPSGTLCSADSRDFYQAVAKLGVQAAEALEHAHEYGIVHRDIKPANLMMDAQGHLWVTDFGLAQLQTDTGLTQTGDLLGTLRYMSPEQAGGRRLLLDHRTDVYSLGATLYELVTFRPPFDGSDRQTLLQQILHEEPRPPRALRRSVPRELDTIVLKSLEKEPDRRYASARELADDLRRFLGNEPIRARPASLGNRLCKWARRHPAVLWAAGALCLLTLAGSLVTAELLRREQANTQRAYENEQQRSREAEERFVLAREELDGMFKLCEEGLADRPHLDSLRRQFLESFLVYYQKLIDQRSDDPAAQVELDATRMRVRQILDDLAVMQGVGQYQLLKEPPVLDDLRLKPGQRERIQELTETMDHRWRASLRDFGRLAPDERRQTFLRLARLAEADVDQLLTPEQRQRLRQIDLQRKGQRAFEEPEVIAALKLTAAQREQIRDLQQEAMIREERLPGGLPGPPPHHRDGRGGPRPHPGRLDRPPPRQGWGERPPIPAAGAFLVTQIEERVLTSEQRRIWQEMTGEPFRGPIPPRHDALGPPHGPPE